MNYFYKLALKSFQLTKMSLKNHWLSLYSQIDKSPKVNNISVKFHSFRFMWFFTNTNHSDPCKTLFIHFSLTLSKKFEPSHVSALTVTFSSLTIRILQSVKFLNVWSFTFFTYVIRKRVNKDLQIKCYFMDNFPNFKSLVFETETLLDSVFIDNSEANKVT